jgi:YbbR domain-containing protein
VRQTVGTWIGYVARGLRSVRVNSPLMLLSLGLATVLWAFVTNQENPSVSLPLSDHFQLSSFDPAVNVPRSMVVTGYAPNDVAVTLIGSQQTVNKVKRQDIQLQVDLNGASVNDSALSGVTVEAPVKATVARRGVRVETDPSVVRVTIEPQAHRNVPIKVSLIDAPPVGFELDAPPVSDPDTAAISGLKQNVDAVDALYADLKLTGLSVTTSVTLQLSPRSSDGRAISGITVQPAATTVRVSIKRTIFNRDAFVSVQTHGRPALGYQVQDARSDPPTVTIAGSLDQLNSITTVPTDDVELEGATAEVRRVVALKPPPGITVVNPRTVTASVTIAAARGPGSVLVAPRIIGAVPGESIQLSVSAITVSFLGPMPLVLGIRPGDVVATIDVSGLAAGTYTLEPRVTLPAGLDRDTVNPSRIELVIALPPPSATPVR